ncbi:hypothetical protein, partial [Methylocella sp.]|uniref:hypothetical protein n=1 Tax=Methylocella sp. TaxID=1978226 RepID=UPI0035B37628
GEPGQEGIEVRFPPRGRRAAASWPSLTVNQTWLTKGFVRASNWGDNFCIDSPRWYRYGGGGTDAGWGYNPPPPHAIYNTGGTVRPSRRRTLILTNPLDFGIDHSEVGGGLCSLKFNGSKKVVIRGGVSYRPHGALQGVCENWDVDGYASTSVYARHAGATTNPTGATISLFNYTYNSDPTDGAGAQLKQGGRICMSVRETGNPAQIINMGGVMDNMSIDLDLSVDDVTGLGMCIAGIVATRCKIKAYVRADTPGVISSIANFFGASIGNCVEVESFDLTNFASSIGSLRFIENSTSSAYNNTLKVTDLNTGDTVETFANGLAILKRTKVVQQTATSGASVNVSGFIPAGARNVIIIPVVKTALGATNGTSGFTVGVTGDTARFAAVSGTAVGSGSAGAYTARAQSSAAPWQYAAAQDVLITPTGGNFDGTGVIQLTIYYEIASQSAYAY